MIDYGDRRGDSDFTRVICNCIDAAATTRGTESRGSVIAAPVEPGLNPVRL